MALDTFTKTGVTTYTFSRGNTYPITHDYEVNEVRTVSGGGASKVVVHGSPQEFWSINLQNISDTDIDNLFNFLDDTLINWSEQIFTWTDHNSVARNVRLWNQSISMPSTGSDLNNVELILKVEN